MKKYRFKIKSYLQALAAKKPSPGGGSAAALSLCLGISLLEKSINYSLQNKSVLKSKITSLEKLKNKAFRYVDLDAEIFEKFMKAKGKKRIVFLNKSNNLVIDLSNTCLKAVNVSWGVESAIKKSIISDFYMGLDFVRVCLLGCVYNLEANSQILGKKPKALSTFKRALVKNNI